MFVEFGKNILGSVAQALALTKGLSKLGETSKSVGEIKQGQSTQIETARKSYDTAKQNLEQTKEMYKITAEDIQRRREELLEKVALRNHAKLEDVIAVDKQAREELAKEKSMKEGGK